MVIKKAVSKSSLPVKKTTKNVGVKKAGVKKVGVQKVGIKSVGGVKKSRTVIKKTAPSVKKSQQTNKKTSKKTAQPVKKTVRLSVANARIVKEKPKPVQLAIVERPRIQTAEGWKRSMLRKRMESKQIRSSR